MKKILAKVPLYYLLFVLLTLSERTLGVYGLAVSFLFSLLYCREKPYVLLPSFVGATVTVFRSVPALVTVAAVTVLSFAVYFIHKKKKWKYTFIEVFLLALLCLVPDIAFGAFDVRGIVAAVLSCIATVATCYVSIIALYPLFARGVSAPRNGNENVCLGILTIVLSVGIAEFTPFSVNVICFLFALFLTPLCAYDFSFALPYGLCVGAGAAIGLYDPSVVFYLAAPALAVFVLAKRPSFVRAIGSLVSFFFVTGFFFGKVDLYSLVPFAAGTLLSLLLPDKFIKRFSPEKNVDRYALRTVVNRDREELSEKIAGIASAFFDMKETLEKEQPRSVSPETVIKNVCEKSCIVCPHFRQCVRDVGDLAVPVRKLVHAGIASGKVTLLDADAQIGKYCVRLPYLLSVVNEETAFFLSEKRRRQSLSDSKEIILAEMGGIADLFKKLSDSVNVRLSFDPRLEKKLFSSLSKSNVVARDVCIYLDGEEPEVSIVVREKDAGKESLPALVGSVVGFPMAEESRKKEINGDVCLHYRRAPNYKVLYGECFSALEDRCGDTRRAVRIDNHRSLFLLSDGMGTGRSAGQTAAKVSDLLEKFYRAGFSHETVFENVSHLLSLRAQEDFSALDAVIVNTRTAEVDFIKQGGRESYLFSDKSYEVVEGNSLPMGIVETTPVTVRRKLRPDDLIVLLSDGVADALTPSEIAQIADDGAYHPKTVADALVKNALRLAEKKDDMTVVCMRIVRA